MPRAVVVAIIIHAVIIFGITFGSERQLKT